MVAVAVTAMREACAWTLDSIWTENYTLIYTFSKLIRNFIALHEWLMDDYRVTGSQLTPTARGRAVTGQSWGLLGAQLSADSWAQRGSSHHGARRQGQGWAFILSW